MVLLMYIRGGAERRVEAFGLQEYDRGEIVADRSNGKGIIEREHKERKRNNTERNYRERNNIRRAKGEDGS
jgi:hypothetical protein